MFPRFRVLWFVGHRRFTIVLVSCSCRLPVLEFFRNNFAYMFGRRVYQGEFKGGCRRGCLPCANERVASRSAIIGIGHFEDNFASKEKFKCMFIEWPLFARPFFPYTVPLLTETLLFLQPQNSSVPSGAGAARGLEGVATQGRKKEFPYKRHKNWPVECIICLASLHSGMWHSLGLLLHPL